MNAHLPSELRGGFVVFLRLGKAGHGLGNVVGDEVRHLLCGRVPEDENGHDDAVCSKLHRLVEARHREIVSAQLLKRFRDVHRAVAVCVGLHDAEELDVLADACAERFIVVPYRVKVDLGPCSAKGGFHAITFIPECLSCRRL